MKKLINLLLLLCIFIAAKAQKTALDEIYMKDGSVIVGQIQTITKEAYKITVAGGSLMVIERSETDSLLLNSRKDNWMSPSGRIYKIDQEGWFNRTAFGFTLGSSEFSYGSSASLFVHNVTGFKITRFLQPGIAVSGETNFNGLSPIISTSAHLEGEILREATTPYYYGEVGYGFPGGAPVSNVLEESGGLSTNFGVGLKFYGEKSTLWFIELSYRHQRRSYVQDRWNGTIESDLRQNRLAFGIGFEF